MAKAGVTVVVDKTAQLARAIDLLTGTRAMVGISAEHEERDDDWHGTLNNAEIGWLMENGIPERNVPARPHMVPGVRRAQSRINDYLKQAGRLAVEGRPDGVMRAFHAAGLTAQNSIKSVIRAGVPPPLAESTLKARARRSRTAKGAKRELAARAAGEAASTTHAKPLIDTGQYLAAISYVVRSVKTAARQIGRRK